MSKQHQEINIQTGLPRAQLKIQLKKNQASIQALSSSVKKKREEMKKMSDNMTKIIEKKLIPKNSCQSTLPIFNPQYKSQAVKLLHSQREQLFSEINRYKQEIEGLKRQQQPQIMSEVHRKEALIENLQRQYNTALKEKQLIQEMLLKNKKVIDNFKESPCIKEIQINQKELDSLRKQIKDLDREILFLMNEDIKITMYSDKMEADMKSFDEVEEITDTVDPAQIQKLIEQVKTILEDRKLIERKFAAQKEEIIRQIREVSQQNTQIQRKIREIANQKLKEELEKKKNQLLLKSKSMPQMALKQKSPKIKYISRKQINFPSLLLSQPSDMKKQKSRIKEADTFFIGVWKPQNLIKDDVIQSKKIARAISMKIRTKQNKIIGVGVTYIDKVGVEVMGRSNIWKLSDDQLEEDQQQHTIDLEDVVSLYYYQNKQSENIANTSIGLKFMTKSSKPTIKVGQFLNEEEGQHINLENKYIKTIQFTLDSNYKSISGIKIVIQAIKEIKNIGIFQQPNEEEQQLKDSHGSQEKAQIKTAHSPGKWLITTTQPEVTEVKKKLFIKKDNNIRRLSEAPLVDHRLMLNRKKKMV